MELTKTKYKNTEIGLIPEDWHLESVGKTALVQRGKFTPRPRNNPIYYNGKFPFIQTGDVTRSNGRINSYSQTLNAEGLAVSKLFKKGTILMTIAANIGYSGVLEIDMACPDSLLGIDGNDNLDNLFLNYYLNHKREDIENLSTSGAQKNLNIELFSPFKIPLPPLSEQKAIAQVLSDTDSLIQTLEQKLAKKRAIKQGAMQQLLTPKKDWVIKKLGALAKYRRGSFPQPYGLPQWYDDNNGTPFVQVYDVDKNMRLKSTTKQKISDLAKDKSVFVEKGNIILTIQGSIGRIALTQYDAYVDRTLLIFTDYKEPIDKVFFSYLIQEKFRIEKENAPGGIIKTITKEALSKFDIPLPKTLEEQLEIGLVLSDMDAEIGQLEQKLEKYKLLKQGLMQELLTGRIRLV